MIPNRNILIAILFPLCLVAALVFIRSWADTAPSVEFDSPLTVVTNAETGNVMASVFLPLDTNAVSHVIQISHTTNGHFRAHTRIMHRRETLSMPPIPPQLKSTVVYSDDVTNWSDFPPERVLVPRDRLPDGARRQWGTITHIVATDVIWKGRTNRVQLESETLTNHLMRIIRPLVDISEPVPAIPTNTTNF